MLIITVNLINIKKYFATFNKEMYQLPKYVMSHSLNHGMQ